MDYHDMIEREKRRRAILVQKLDETDRRIAMLNAMSDQSDPLDKWLDEQTAGAANDMAADVTSARRTDARPVVAMTRDTPRKISSQWIDIIEHLSIDGKDFAAVQEFQRHRGTPMSDGATRTGLMNYRKHYGLIANPRPGFYVATPKGMDLVRAYRERESAN